MVNWVAGVGAIPAGCLLAWSISGLPSVLRPSMDFLPIIVLSTIFFTLARLVQYSIIIPWIKHQPGVDDIKAHKYAQQLMNITIHGISSLTLLYVLPSREWFWSPAALWTEYPNQDQQFVDIGLYLLQLGYHINCLCIHFTEPHRDDHIVMIVHHCSTVILLGTSYAWNFIRIGLMVLLYHDISDCTVCLCKLANYLNWMKVGVAFFPLMVSFWIVFRLTLFPKLIIDIFYFAPQTTAVYVCTFCLSVLVVLHLHWFRLMVVIAFQVKKSVVKGSYTNLTDLSEEKQKTN